VPFWRRKPYSRTETLAAADKARGRGRIAKAIAGYQKVLAVHPDDLAVHAKVAPLLARRGRRDEALASFRLAAEGQEKAGFPDRALSLLAQASERYPDVEPLWGDMARLQLLRGRRADAVVALVRGGGRLLGTPHRDVGERLLRRALQLEPWQLDGTLLLARTLWRLDRRTEALELLDGLALVVRGPALRAARRLAFRLRPTPVRLWRWLRA
jgi:tetratricopeptide (TPR) repeat protein